MSIHGHFCIVLDVTFCIGLTSGFNDNHNDNNNHQVEWKQSRAVKDRLLDITTVGCTLIHWAGHGRADALMAEDDWGRLNELSPDILQQMCQRGVSVALITSCFSEYAGRAFVKVGTIPPIMSMSMPCQYQCQCQCQSHPNQHNTIYLLVHPPINK